MLAALSLASCGDRDTVSADAGNSAASRNVDVDVLPPDETIATPDNELAAGAQNTGNWTDADNAAAEGNRATDQTL